MLIAIESEVHLLRRLSRFLPKISSVPSWADEEAIREELFSVERLEQHAESLAAAVPESMDFAARGAASAR